MVGSCVSVPKDVGQRQVVPGTTLTYFNHIDPEFTEFPGHLLELVRRLDPSRVPAELVPVHVRDMGEPLLPADGTGPISGLAMILRRTQEIGVRVAGVRDGQAA